MGENVKDENNAGIAIRLDGVFLAAAGVAYAALPFIMKSDFNYFADKVSHDPVGAALVYGLPALIMLGLGFGNMVSRTPHQNAAGPKPSCAPSLTS